MTVLDVEVPIAGGEVGALWKQRAIAFLQTMPGRLAMVAVFTALMFALRMPLWRETAILLALISLFPAQKRMFIAAGAMWWIFLEPPIRMESLTRLAVDRGAMQWVNYWPIAVAGAWAIAWGYIFLIRRFSRTYFGRRPIMFLLILFAGMLVAAAELPLRGAAWFFVAMTTVAFSQYLWFFAYTIADHASPDKHVSPLQVGAWRPFWGFTGVPYGKGYTYLSRVEARNDRQLAEVQLRGLKLLIRAACLTVLLALGNRYIYGSTESWTKIPMMTADPLIPTYHQALEHMREGHPYSLPMRWLALWASFFLRVTVLAIFGHKVIAIARMAGFDAFRNTYRPFSSTSIADLFNRVYYYFKELLVTFFFYPTYLRYFKKHPKLRLFVATLAAAGLGNWLFHFLRDSQNVLEMGPIGAMNFYAPYAVYALLLGSAIALSQIRTLSRGKAARPPGALRKYAAIAGVLLFYTFICIFEEPNKYHGLADYKAYFISLFRP